ncbi:type VI secretion system baseplate subunit TssG [Rubrivivax gelatinosus]|nr:type VI secretion system baseplate subunit TssG [Rubrivivax gelatinosus]
MNPAPDTAAVEALLADLQARPWAHDFFALLRRLDALHPGLPRTGSALRPSQEALRLGQPPELDFAPAALQKLERRDGAPPRLLVRFFGLLGPQGPMPLHLTEHVRERQHQHADAAGAHFLDLFHHRLLALFYRAWAQAQPVVHGDRPGDDRFIAWLAALAGTPGAAAGVEPRALACQAGLLSMRVRPAEAMAKVLAQQFDTAVEVQPNVAQWLPIDAQDCSALGFARNRAERGGRPAAALGRCASAGSRVWDRQFRFRLRLGPLPLARYLDFLPGGRHWSALLHWVGVLARPELQCELELVLAAADRPAPRLQRGLRLGVTSWLAAPRGAAPAATALRLRPATSFLQRRALHASA